MWNIPINEQGWGLFYTLLREFLLSAERRKGVALFLALIVLLVGVNALNVVNSYVGRDFISALAERNVPAYIRQAFFYVGVFAVITVVSVLLRYAEESLGLLGREWMTKRFLSLYLQYPTYYRINNEMMRDIDVHPDQRIADDVRTFTVSTLSFFLMVLNGLFTVLAFSGVLWSISPLLFGAALLYAGAGSYFTIRLGSSLIALNYTQLDHEAAFRSGLTHVRERAESVALLHREKPLLARLMRQFDGVAQNFRNIIRVNRSLGFFTTGYNYLVQIIPILIAAPLFLRGEAEFGVITQSAMAFAALVGAFSLIITQFQSISSYAAVMQRLINLWYTIELAQTTTVSGLDVREEDGRLAYENIDLRSALNGRILVQDLTLSIPQGTRVLVLSADEEAKSAFCKATAGLQDIGTGCVVRPALGRILFLPSVPYLPPGTLRQSLLSSPAAPEGSSIPEEKITETLRELGGDSILGRVGGLDEEHNWDNLLSVQEQHTISLARILLAEPSFVVLDRPGADFAAQHGGQMLRLLTERGITYLTIAGQGQVQEQAISENYDAILELEAEGKWNWREMAK